MKAYLQRSRRRIEPFGDSVCEMPVLNDTLGSWQRRILRPFVGEVVEIDNWAEVGQYPALVLQDNLFFTARAIGKFLRRASRGGASVRLSLPDCAWLREKLPLQDVSADRQGAVSFPIYYLTEPVRNGELHTLPSIPIPVREHLVTPENLAILAEDLDIRYAFTRDAVMAVQHWSHLHDINQAALFDYWFHFSPGHLGWLFACWLRSLSFNRWKILRRAVRRGRGCRIHPSAVVEASVLGDHVRIGPHAVVRGSFLGDHVKIDSYADVNFSILGARSIAAFRAKANFCILFPQSLISEPGMQMGIMGRRAMYLNNAFAVDMKLSRDLSKQVTVMDQGRLVESGKRFLGICLGHEAVVGTHVVVNAGVAVPNGFQLVMPSGQIVTRIDPALPAGVPLTLRGGRLQPARSQDADHQEKP